MRRMAWLPVTEGDFLRREASGEQQWNKVSQRLQQLTLEIDRLRAIVNGLKRVLHDADAHGVARDPLSRERFKQEILQNERDLENYQQYVKYYRQAIEMGRVQIGFGDQRYVMDDQVRRQFRQLFAREVALAAASGRSSELDYAREIQPILQQADALEAHLENIRSRYEQKAESSARQLLAVVSEEAANIESYARALEELDQNARVLVGEVAMKNFGLVRDRLKNIVLRADVGIVQQAWEVREENRFRVRDLQRERAREEQRLNDELREVLDDAEESQ
jgi:hypothetical protein